jgi:hypothetical protein
MSAHKLRVEISSSTTSMESPLEQSLSAIALPAAALPAAALPAVAFV